MENNKKYKFITHKPGKKPVTYFKSEKELTEEELDILYQEFAKQWDFIPLKAKNRFMKWLRESLQERADKQKN